MDILKIINNNDYKKLLSKLTLNTLNKDIINGKSIIHILASRGNIDVINKIIKKFKNFNIYKTDKNGNTFFHILFINGVYDINLIKKHPNALLKTNNENKLIIRYCIDNYSILNKLLKYIKSKNKINILETVSKDNTTIIHDIIGKINKKNRYYNILQFILDSNFNINDNIYHNVLFYCIENNNIISFKLIIKYMNNLNIKDSHNIPLLSFAIIHNSYEITKAILNNKNIPDINNGGIENRFIPLNIAIINENNKIIKLLLDKNVNIDMKDRYQNTGLHNILLNWDDKKYKIKILLDMINRGSMFIKNSTNNSPLDILVKNKKLKKVRNILKDKYPKLLNKENNIQSSIKYKSKTMFDKNSVKEYDFGLFNSDTIHSMIYTTNFLRKYKNLIILTQHNNKENKEFDLWKLKMYNNSHTEYGQIIYEIAELYTSIFYNLVPHVIIWRSIDLHFIHPNIVYYIKKGLLLNPRYIMIKLTLIPNLKSTHANLILYDNIRKEIYRFEPYGKSISIDSNSLDEKIKEIFKEALDTEFKYYLPEDYLNNTLWQTLSNENENKMLGDPQGYCLAWCYWFLDTRLNNPDIDIKLLMDEQLSMINNKYKSDDKILFKIRHYAHKLDNEKNHFMMNINIPTKKIYNTAYTFKDLNKIKASIEKNILNFNEYK